MHSLGYHVGTRTSSTEALGLFEAKPDAFDLVITDLTMPNMADDWAYPHLSWNPSSTPTLPGPFEMFLTISKVFD